MATLETWPPSSWVKSYSEALSKMGRSQSWLSGRVMAGAGGSRLVHLPPPIRYLESKPRTWRRRGISPAHGDFSNRTGRDRI